MIVEEEQKGKARAAYGGKLLKDLSAKLTDRFGKGWSVENLTLMRKFYLVYSNQLETASPIAVLSEDTALGTAGEIVNTVYEIRVHIEKFSTESQCFNRPALPMFFYQSG